MPLNLNNRKFNDILRNFLSLRSYQNYYEKVKTYADIISAPAKYLDNDVTEKTFIPVIDSTNETVFQYIDTNSSRANIELINLKFSNIDSRFGNVIGNFITL